MPQIFQLKITFLNLLQSPTTPRHLDFVSTTLVKACLPSISSPITSIINSSLSTGTVPPSLKVAIIRPTLKKTGPECNDQTTTGQFPTYHSCPNSWEGCCISTAHVTITIISPNIAQKLPSLRSPTTSSLQLIPV